MSFNRKTIEKLIESSRPIVSCKNISYKVKNSNILNNISFDIYRGEFVGIIGPNGAGKSTLLGLLNETIQPTGGNINVDGIDVWSLSKSHITKFRTNIGTVLQKSDYSNMIPMTVWDVAAIGRTARKGFLRSLDSEDNKTVDESLSIMGMSDFSRRTYRSLSGGEQQKVQIARALAQQPDILLLDEPTSGLDMEWQERLIELIGSLYKKTKITIVMSTHITGHLPSCCQRVMLLRDGVMKYDGLIDEGLTPERLGELYDCSVEVVLRDNRRHCYSIGGNIL